MSFQPITPVGGIAGWSFLNRTLARQQESFRNSALAQRNAQYFRKNIAGISSAKDLISDRKLLVVALGAFGLEDDVNKGAFIRKVLEEGTTDSKAMANRLVDKRYARLADAFGFGNPFGNRIKLSAFPDEIISKYETRQFEAAVGNQNEGLRLALGFRREMTEISLQTNGITGWFSILGSAPLRKVVEDAFNLPTEFSQLDLDSQVRTLREKARLKVR